jgi:hypothetical protein
MKQRARPDLRPIREKSLDELEGVSMRPPYVSGMVEHIADARRVPVGRLELLDLRLLLSQQQAPRYLLPVALDRLEADPLMSAGLYTGDLLRAVLRNEDTAAGDGALRDRLRAVLSAALARLERVGPTSIGALPGPDEFDRRDLEPDLRAALARLAPADDAG